MLENREWGCVGLGSVLCSIFRGEDLGSEAIEDRVDACIRTLLLKQDEH
jgi:hypothetical protein